MNKGHSVLGVVTGKPLTIGGSLGREEATARGALFCIRDAVAKRDGRLDGMTAAVQGFGNVGSFLAKFLHEEGAKVVAISDSRAALYNPKGIDIAAAFAHKREHGTLAGLKDADQMTNDELLLLDVDILAPCALEQVITERNANDVKASIICEGANGPVTPAADAILEDKGVLILPGRARERGRRHRVVLRVGSGPAGVLLEGDRGEREAQRHHEPRLRRNVGDRGTAQHADARRVLRARRPACRGSDDHPWHLPVRT